MKLSPLGRVEFSTYFEAESRFSLKKKGESKPFVTDLTMVSVSAGKTPEDVHFQSEDGGLYRLEFVREDGDKEYWMIDMVSETTDNIFCEVFVQY